MSPPFIDFIISPIHDIVNPFFIFFLVGGLSEGGGSVLQDPRGWVFFSFIKVYIIIAAVYHDLVCTNVCNIF